jgi:hypothetical protein
MNRPASVMNPDGRWPDNLLTASGRRSELLGVIARKKLSEMPRLRAACALCPIAVNHYHQAALVFFAGLPLGHLCKS